MKKLFISLLILLLLIITYRDYIVSNKIDHFKNSRELLCKKLSYKNAEKVSVKLGYELHTDSKTSFIKLDGSIWYYPHHCKIIDE